MTFSKKSNFKDFDPFLWSLFGDWNVPDWEEEGQPQKFLVRATFSFFSCPSHLQKFFLDVPRTFWLSCLCSRSFSWLLPSLRIWFLAQNWNILQMLCTQRKYWFVKSVVCRNTIDKIFKKIIKFLRTLFLNVWTMGVVSNVILYLNVRLNKEVVY